MKLTKLALGAVIATMMAGNAMACIPVPVCPPNPCNYGGGCHEVSDCGHGSTGCGTDKGCGIVIVIIKILFGCGI